MAGKMETIGNLEELGVEKQKVSWTLSKYQNIKTRPCEQKSELDIRWL
jgi:hypothetical protein